MFCPKCGQRQAADDVRFCSGCGFTLNVVADVLAGGGQLHWRPPAAPATPQPLSPRQKGVRQGAMLMLSTLLVVPIVIFLGVALLNLPGVLIPLAGAVCIFGGLLRMLYALFLEEDSPRRAAPRTLTSRRPRRRTISARRLSRPRSRRRRATPPHSPTGHATTRASWSSDPAASPRTPRDSSTGSPTSRPQQ